MARSWGRFSNFYSRVVVIRTCGRFLKLHFARGSGSIMGSLFKFLLARGTDSYMCSLFSKCTSRVVLVPSWDRCLAGDAEDPAGKIHWARIRPSAKSLLAMLRGRPARDSGFRRRPKAAKIQICQCGVILGTGT